MDYGVDGATGNSIFDDVDGYVTEASTAHDSVSTDIDNMAAACSTGKAASIGPALNDVYNRLLASAMCTAEQQTTNAAAGGREAVSAIQNGDEEMSNNAETAANSMDEVTVDWKE